MDEWKIQSPLVGDICLKTYAELCQLSIVPMSLSLPWYSFPRHPSTYRCSVFGDVWGMFFLARIPPREVFGCPGIDRNLKIEGMDKGGTCVYICTHSSLESMSIKSGSNSVCRFTYFP